MESQPRYQIFNAYCARKTTHKPIKTEKIFCNLTTLLLQPQRTWINHYSLTRVHGNLFLLFLTVGYYPELIVISASWFYFWIHSSQKLKLFNSKNWLLSKSLEISAGKRSQLGFKMFTTVKWKMISTYSFPTKWRDVHVSYISSFLNFQKRSKQQE